MQKITPCLWFDFGAAEDAVRTYTNLLPDSEIIQEERGEDGSLFFATARIAGLEIQFLAGGPTFTPTPAVSLMIGCKTADEVDRIWNTLIDGGFAMMELGEYPFSPRYGWLQDRHGISWQIMQTDDAPFNKPCLLFVGDQFGKVEQAIDLYTGLFPDSAKGELSRGEKGEVNYGPFTLAGVDLVAMESDLDHQFTFTEGTSLSVICEDQAEVDRYWNALTANGGKESQCGWLYDPFGVSWQIVPRRLLELRADPDPERAKRAHEAMLTMRKLDIAELEAAASGVTA